MTAASDAAGRDVSAPGRAGSEVGPPVRSVRSVRLSTKTVVLAVGTILAFVMARSAFVSAHRVIGWTVAAAATAVLVEPIVELLARVLPRLLAVLLTFLLVGAAVGGLIFGTFDDLDRELDRLQRAAPSATAALEARDDSVGRVARELRLSERADVFLDTLDDRVGSGSGALAENAPAAPAYLVSAILTIFLLVYGPRLLDGALRQLPPSVDARRARAVLFVAAQRTQKTVAVLLTQAIVVGLAVWATAVLLGLPAPVVLGAVAGIGALLPDLGVLLGVLPTVALTAGLESVTTATLLLVAALVVQGIEALVIRARIDRWGVPIGPAVVWVVALVAYTVYGVGAALFGVVYAIFGLAVVDALSRPARRSST